MDKKNELPTDKSSQTYRRQMIEAKRRMRTIDRILGARKPLSGDLATDHELGFLQLRKIVELVTFSCIVADEQRYQRSRELDAVSNKRDKGDYASDWNAGEILSKLVKISPHALPRPLGPMEVQSDGVKHFLEAKAKATHDRLIEIYKIAGGFAHVPNPFKLGINEQEQRKQDTARQVLKKELNYLKSIIWEHVKIGLPWSPGMDPLEAESGETAWLIWFGDKNSNDIKFIHAQAAHPAAE